MTDLPDGALPRITSSGFSACNNIMIIKVPNEMKGTGESSFQLATIDPSKNDDEWPADDYAKKLIPKLQEKAKLHEILKAEESTIIVPLKEANSKKTKQTVFRSSVTKPKIRRKSKTFQRSHGSARNAADINPWITDNDRRYWLERDMLTRINPVIQNLNNAPIHMVPNNIHKKGLLGDHPAHISFTNIYPPLVDNILVTQNQYAANYSEYLPSAALNSSDRYVYKRNPSSKPKYRSNRNSGTRGKFRGKRVFSKNRNRLQNKARSWGKKGAFQSA